MLNCDHIIFISAPRLYPAIISDEERCKYKKEFDFDLAQYKKLCSEVYDISDQMQKLSRELDTLDEDSMKYQVKGQKIQKTDGFNLKNYVFED